MNNQQKAEVFKSLMNIGKAVADAVSKTPSRQAPLPSGNLSGVSMNQPVPAPAPVPTPAPASTPCVPCSHKRER